MAANPILSKSPFPINMGFETQHRCYFTTAKERVVFNALRIMSYIPIISLVGVLIKLNYEKNWKPRFEQMKVNFHAEWKATQDELAVKRFAKLTPEDMIAMLERTSKSVATHNQLKEIIRLHSSHRVRAIFETVGLGIIYLPMDLYHTAYRAIPIFT